MNPATIETEFGVPIPGEILPAERWTRTALKKLPPTGPLDLVTLFGRPAPLVLDIGCGNGRFTLGSALARPEFDHLASDILPVVIRYATRRANQRGLSNVRFAVIGGRELLREYIAPRSVAEIHVYHPQPYYERREHRFRLVTPDFLCARASSLAARRTVRVADRQSGVLAIHARSRPGLLRVHGTRRQLARCPARPHPAGNSRAQGRAARLPRRRPSADRA